jgi:hypothetical protein
VNREVWRPIRRGKYEVSNRGRVRNAETKHVRSPFLTWAGHQVVQFYVSSATIRGKRKQRRDSASVGSLVAQAFLGQRPRNTILRWMNGDRADSRLENLRYVPLTRSRPGGERRTRYRRP